MEPGGAGHAERIDHEAIRSLLARYCHGIDRRDRELVADCFHPDATDDHGHGPRPVEDFLDWCFELLGRYDSTFHLLGQSLIEPLDAVRAVVETYGIAHHRCVDGPDHLNLVTGFRYLDRVERRGGRWRIAARTAVTDWSRVDRQAEWWPIPPDYPRGSPGPDDPGVRWLRSEHARGTADGSG